MSLDRTGLPFGGFAVPYVEFAWKAAPNAAGLLLVANTLTKITMTTITQDTGSLGVTAGSNNLQNLPAGTYYFEAETCYNIVGAADTLLVLWNESDGSAIAAAKRTNQSDYSDPIELSGQFKITASKNLSLKIMCGVAKTVGVSSASAFTDSTAGLDQRATVKLWKVG